MHIIFKWQCTRIIFLSHENIKKFKLSDYLRLRLFLQYHIKLFLEGDGRFHSYPLNWSFPCHTKTDENTDELILSFELSEWHLSVPAENAVSWSIEKFCIFSGFNIFMCKAFIHLIFRRIVLIFRFFKSIIMINTKAHFEDLDVLFCLRIWLVYCRPQQVAWAWLEIDTVGPKLPLLDFKPW